MNRSAEKGETVQTALDRIRKELSDLRVSSDAVKVIATTQQDKVNIQTDLTSDIFERAVRNPMEDELDANRQNILNINELAATELSSDVAKFNSLTVGGAAITGGGSTTFVSLTDTPADLTGNARKTVKVNTNEDALVFEDFSFVGLTGTPDQFRSGDAGKTVKVNSAEDALEFADFSFVSLTDTPADLTGNAEKTVKVNSAGDALEFADFSFVNLSDGPGLFRSGDAGKVVMVNNNEDQLVFGPKFPQDLVVTDSNGVDLANVIASGSGGGGGGGGDPPTEITLDDAAWLGNWGYLGSFLPALGTTNVTNGANGVVEEQFNFNRAAIVYMVNLDGSGSQGSGLNHAVDTTQWWVHSNSTSGNNHNEHWSQDRQGVTPAPTTLYWKIFPAGNHKLPTASSTFFFKPFPAPTP